MSGGFFRGTSADQDTRFSNKQAKLLKSQKFAPELEHLVDTTKVKMDVIRPWIATRATELLGFEDEVLINFIYGLLEGNEVDGKQIQIQLTGFMEKNTGKFMRELWGLLLSAQKNASGVPQQFLDAKEEELKKKKVETDRITQEIQKRKERSGWESEQDKKSWMDEKMDTGMDVLPRKTNNDVNAILKESSRKSVSVDSEGESEKRHNARRKSRFTPPARSSSRSSSKSRSHSRGHRSRSPSISFSHRKHSAHEKQYRSSLRCSFSPKGIGRSPSRRRSPTFTRRSSSRTCYRSPPLVRHRTPEQRRTHERRRTPERRALDRRSPKRRTPERRRNHERQRSPSPHCYRSPPSPCHSPRMLRRSAVHGLQKLSSPLWRRSVVHRGTPPGHSSPSPLVRRSPTRFRSSRYHSPSPTQFRSPRHRSSSPTQGKFSSQNSLHCRRRNHQSSESWSPPSRSRSLKRDPDNHVSWSGVRKSLDDDYRRSPFPCAPEKEETKLIDSEKRGLDSVSHPQTISLRPPQQDLDSSESSFEELCPKTKKRSYVHAERPASKTSPLLDEIENGSQKSGEKSYSSSIRGNQLSNQDISPQKGGSISQKPFLKSPTLRGRHKSKTIKQKYHDNDEYKFECLSVEETKGKKGQNVKENSGSQHFKYDEPYSQIEWRTKKLDIQKEDAEEESAEQEKEAKRRRRKEEKRLRKEEKHRKRDERHRRKRAEKRAKYIDTVTPPPDYNQSQNTAGAPDDVGKRRETHPSDNDETEIHKKKLEIELREKALESLRAKKAVTH